MFTARMTQLFAVVLARDKDRVTEALLREGVMQFIRTSELEARGTAAPAAAPSIPRGEVTDLRKRIEGMLQTIGIIPAAPKETDLNRRRPVDLKQETQQIDRMDGERANIRERQRMLQQEILRMQDIQRQVRYYGLGLDKADLPAGDSILTMQTGRLPAGAAERLDAELRGMPALAMDLGEENGETHHLLVTMKRDRDRIDRILSGLRWSRDDVTPDMLSRKQDLYEELAGKIARFEAEQKELQRQVDRLIEEQADHLQSVWVDLRLEELCLRIQDHFESSARTVLFVGWLPEEQKPVLEQAITAASENRCYLEWIAAGDEEMIGDEVPVQLRNPRAFAPFQMLVSNFGIPQYGTIDPTPFVMPLYLAMFGLMFADAGQGAVLVLLGALGARSMAGNDGKKNMRQLAWLIIWCGASSILFGALFGSYFGFPWFRPLWFDFHGIVTGHRTAGSAISSIYDILRITIYFGITVISLGLLFNWINLARTRQWLPLVFDKGGLLGGWMYGGLIYSAAFMVKQGYKALPSGGLLLLLLGVPALLLLLKEPLHRMQHPQHAEAQSGGAMLIMNTLMEWVVELLEIFSGYLSNTLSFMRVAGLGIAHVCLMISFITMAGMTDAVVLKVLILLIGNLLVIGLEGLSAGIQALRLNYYEFFTKFFHGTGRLHTPISLGSAFQE